MLCEVYDYLYLCIRIVFMFDYLLQVFCSVLFCFGLFCYVLDSLFLFVVVQFQSFTLNSNSIMEYTPEMRKSQCMNIANTFIVGEERTELKGNRFLTILVGCD